MVKPNASVDFEYIKSLFDDTWDVGYLSAEHLKQCAYHPVKGKYHIYGADFSNNTHFVNLNNSIVLLKTSHTWDYSHYQEAEDIMQASGIEGWYPSYTNYKHAAIHAGLGVRAKNSLVYSFKFGFDCHVCMISFWPEIVNYPDRSKKRNYGLWKHCEGCDDCIVNCPAKAIHFDDKEPPWIDAAACENFIFFGDDERVPNVIDYWHKNVHPEIPKEQIEDIKRKAHTGQPLPDIKWDANGYSFDGNVTKKDGEMVYVPHCRECTSQPRCSKWNGNYPYEKFLDNQ